MAGAPGRDGPRRGCRGKLTPAPFGPSPVRARPSRWASTSHSAGVSPRCSWARSRSTSQSDSLRCFCRASVRGGGGSRARASSARYPIGALRSRPLQQYLTPGRGGAQWLCHLTWSGWNELGGNESFPLSLFRPEAAKFAYAGRATPRMHAFRPKCGTNLGGMNRSPAVRSAYHLLAHGSRSRCPRASLLGAKNAAQQPPGAGRPRHEFQ